MKFLGTSRSRKSIMSGLGALLLVGVGVMSAYAAQSMILGSGTLAHFDSFGGPATMTTRALSLTAGEVSPWHEHPGIGAFTIVNSGTLTIEDGCGGEVAYPQGTAFIEPPGRVHRGKAGPTSVEAVQTFLVPVGVAFSVNVPQGCGPPLLVEECKSDGWAEFTHPRAFANQGDCIQYVEVRS